MALVFSGGHVTLPAWSSSTTAFNISGTMTYQSATGTAISALGQTAEFLWTASSSRIIFKFAGISYTVTITGVAEDDVISFEIDRDGAGLVTTTASNLTTPAGPFAGGSGTNGGVWEIDVLGTYGASGVVLYQGEMTGTLTMVNTTETRTYDMDGSTGTTLTDTTSAQNGTLVGSVTLVPASTPGITITSVQSNQFKKKDGSNQAIFPISGDIVDRPAGEHTVYRLDGGAWLDLDTSTTGSTFSGNVTITGKQDLDVAFSTTTTTSDSLTGLAAVFTIGAWWQSNESGQTTSLQTYSPGVGEPVAVMQRNGDFNLLADPVGLGTTGSLWPAIAELYSADDILIGVCNVAVGSTSILRWQPSAADLYPTLKAAGDLVGGFSMTCSIGGETDSTTSANTAAIVKAALNATIDEIFTDFGCKHFLTNFPRQEPLSFPRDSVILGVFDEVRAENANCEDGGNLQLLDMTDSVDGTHISTTAQADSAAQIRYTAFNAAAATVGFSIGAPVFSASGSAVVPIDNSNIAFTVDAPTFSATAQSLPVVTGAAISIVVAKPEFSSTAQSILPINSATVSFTVLAPLFSAAAQSIDPEASSTANITINAPVFNSTAQAIGVDIVASVDISISGPVFSVFAGEAILEYYYANGTQITVIEKLTIISAP